MIQITTGTKPRAQKVVAHGQEGVGKSTLASKLDRPLFLDCEGGTDQLDVSRVTIHNMNDFREACLYLEREAHDFGTVVVDTVDWLASRDVEEMLEEDKVESVESYGYGKGYKKAEERFHGILKLLDRLQAKGLHVVLLAHTKVMKFELPDQGGQFDRYELKLEKKIAPLVKEWCDAMLFMMFETKVVERVKGNEAAGKRAVGGKERVIQTEHAAAWDAKNRHGLPPKVKPEPEALAPIFDLKPEPAQEAPAPEGQPDPAEADPDTEPDNRADSIEAAFADLVASIGEEKVEAFLKTRNLTLATVDGAYVSRVLDNAEAFKQQVESLAADA